MNASWERDAQTRLLIISFPQLATVTDIHPPARRRRAPRAMHRIARAHYTSCTGAQDVSEILGGPDGQSRGAANI